MKDYAHFWAQGQGPSKDRTCPLWSENTKVHDTEVAKAAQEGRELLEEKNMKLKHDPTKDAPKVAAPPPEGGNPPPWVYVIGFRP